MEGPAGLARFTMMQRVREADKRDVSGAPLDKRLHGRRLAYLGNSRIDFEC